MLHEYREQRCMTPGGERVSSMCDACAAGGVRERGSTAPTDDGHTISFSTVGTLPSDECLTNHEVHHEYLQHNLPKLRLPAHEGHAGRRYGEGWHHQCEVLFHVLRERRIPLSARGGHGKEDATILYRPDEESGDEPVVRLARHPTHTETGTVALIVTGTRSSA